MIAKRSSVESMSSKSQSSKSQSTNAKSANPKLATEQAGLAACPDAELLQRYLVGNITPDQFNSITLHLNECTDCQDKLTQVSAADNWVDRFRGAIDRKFMDEHELPSAMLQCVQTSAPIPSHSLPPTDAIGAYELIRPLGRGGMGTVYLARHKTLNRLCAIKLLPNQAGQQRFDREVQSLAAIDHPGVVPATDAGTHDRWRYLVMQYVDGIDLADVLDSRGSLPIPVVCRIGAEMASAIAAIHHAGLVHRDIKPANVMLTREGETKVLDFGLAAATTVDTTQDRLTTVGDLVGTIAYAAPEQLAGHAPTVAVDWYAFGSTLFRMFTGSITHPDAARRGLTALMMAKSADDFEANERTADLPDEIQDLLAKLLNRDPDQRLIDPQAIIETLRPHQEADLDTLARLVGPASQQLTSASLEPTERFNAAASAPPNRTSWIPLATAFFGGALALFSVGWIIELRSKKGNVTVETDQPDVALKITERAADAPTNDEAQATPDVDSRYANIDPAKLSAVYQGKTVREHLATLENELHVPTLVDSIDAISRVAEPGDTQLVRAAIFPSRRYGGWIAGDNTPSGDFMNEVGDAYRQLPLEDVVNVIAEEMKAGHERSIAMSMWQIIRHGGVPLNERISRDALENLIAQANAYQAVRTARTSPNPYIDTPASPTTPGTIGKWNLGWVRDWLLEMAAADALEVEKIADIRSWLSVYWTPAEFDWVTDSELLKKLEHSHPYGAMTTTLGAVLENVWPIANADALQAADKLGVPAPIVFRFVTLVDSVNLQPGHAQALDLNSMSKEELKTLANSFVLQALPSIIVPESNRPIGYGFGTNYGRQRVQTYSSQFTGNMDTVATKVLRCSEIWIDDLDILRDHTDMPENFDVIVARIHSIVSWNEIPVVPNPLTGIANVESTKPSDSYLGGGGMGMGGMVNNQQPSPADIAKAKAIKAKLDAYLERRSASEAEEADGQD